MNKQEFIERMKSLKNLFGNKSEYVEIDAVIELASELDEPQKVTIPQFVAEYIEFKKKYDFHVYGAMREIEDHYDKRVQEWFYEGNIETFARAWIDGYEVEEEKRYTVKMRTTNQPLFYNSLEKKLFFSLGELATQFTFKQLEEAGFGDVFDSPLFEVEEVEE